MTEIELRMFYNQSVDFCMSRVIDVFIILFYVNFHFPAAVLENIWARTYHQLIPAPSLFKENRSLCERRGTC